MNERYAKYLAVAALVSFFSFWQARVSGHLSLPAFATFMLFVLLCLAYGDAFLAATAGLARNRGGMPFQFLCGYFLFNTLLFIAALISPFGMPVNILLVALGGVGLAAFGRMRPANVDHGGDDLASLLCVMVSGVAATLWCTDAQTQPLIQGQAAIYQTWQDVFIHVREISAFAQSHGISTIQDVKQSGAPAPIYHFASYLSPAAVSLMTGSPAIDIYSSFQLPFGIFLTGLAAFSLIGSIWGNWPALAATVAIVLLPDAYQQGFANRYLSYNFLAQVNLGMLYGMACIAIAWVFILEGSRRGSVASILVGYLFLALCLVYKAHIFVANAFLILIYPCLFFAGLRAHWRVLIGLALTALFVVVVVLSQTIDRVPVLRLDGSGISPYGGSLLSLFDEGFLKTFFTRVFKHEQHAKPVLALYVAAMLSISTFGLWLAATPLVAAAGRTKFPAAVLAFPFLVAANYLVMSMGLAIDTRQVGSPFELLNRPLVWAYFAVAAWTAGGAYYLLIGNRLPRSWKYKVVLFGLLGVAFAGPLVFARNLQTFPVRQGFASYQEFNSVPLCLVKAAQYVRDNSHAEEVVQDSENDPHLLFTALSERQLFAGEATFGGQAKDHQERLDGLSRFRNTRNADELRSYMAANAISWYLLRPDTPVSWPSSFLQGAAFDCDGYRVFRFEK